PSGDRFAPFAGGTGRALAPAAHLAQLGPLACAQRWSAHAEIPGAGNDAHSSRISAATRAATASSSGAERIVSLKPAMRCISAGVMPREVAAGVPRRMPDGSNGLRGSNGTVL